MRALGCLIEKHDKLVPRGNGGRLEPGGPGATEDQRWDIRKQEALCTRRYVMMYESNCRLWFFYSRSGRTGKERPGRCSRVAGSHSKSIYFFTYRPFISEQIDPQSVLSAAIWRQSAILSVSDLICLLFLSQRESPGYGESRGITVKRERR